MQWLANDIRNDIAEKFATQCKPFLADSDAKLWTRIVGESKKNEEIMSKEQKRRMK